MVIAPKKKPAPVTKAKAAKPDKPDKPKAPSKVAAKPAEA
jgi:hypothetical protein